MAHLRLCGYFKIKDIEACEAAGIAYVPRSIRELAVREGYFAKELFLYDADKDVYTCPSSAPPSPRYEGKARQQEDRYCDHAACKTCALKPAARQSLSPGLAAGERGGPRPHDHPTRRPAEILDLRRESVEHLFGTIKQWMNQGAFLMRGLDNVRGEFSLPALAYNIKRAITIVGVPGLIAAVRA
ncbi:MAG: transposase [Shinella sp.]|nr:transposase [Shinella sp.]